MDRIPVLHFGGNGHAAARLGGVCAVIEVRGLPVRVLDAPYPGFEGRERADGVEAFLGVLGNWVDEAVEGSPESVGVASGIGGLIALGLRARGHLVGVPLVFQAPVLWGLEQRSFPRVMRAVPALRGLLSAAFRVGVFQRRFERKHFERPMSPAMRAGFFEGYRQCSAFGDFFDWFTPEFLRDLERRFAERPRALDGVEVWWGGRDHVVTLDELRVTEKALGVLWPVVEFPQWGHYPMIDAPEEWVDALEEFLALHVPATVGAGGVVAAGSVSRSGGPEALES